MKPLLRSPSDLRRAERLKLPGAPVPMWPSIRVPRATHLPEDSALCADPTFALGVSHCPWLRERADNMAVCRPLLRRPGIPYTEETGRAPNHVWSRKLWGWGAAQRASHVVFLQDDLRIAPIFWAVIEAMVRAVPNRSIALIANHPMSERALAAGHTWYRLCETLGSGYIVPTTLMRAFLPWRDALPEATAAASCEDFLVTRWLYETGRQSWCPIPSVIQTQDAAIRTTNPHLQYPFRKSYITWEDPRVAGEPITTVDYWRPRTPPPDFGHCVTQDTRFPTDTPFTNAEVLAADDRLSRRPPSSGSALKLRRYPPKSDRAESSLEVKMDPTKPVRPLTDPLYAASLAAEHEKPFDPSVAGARREYDLATLPDLAGPVVLDLGANIGNFARCALERWAGAIVHCYEPHPATYARLRGAEDLARIGATNAAVVHPARGKMRLYAGVNGDHECSLRDDIRWPHLSQRLDVWVDVDTVDAETLPPCDVLKVDTEGSEIEILEGYRHLGGVKILLTEAHAVGGNIEAQAARIAEIAASAGLRWVGPDKIVARFVRP